MLALYLSMVETDEERKAISEIYNKHLDWMLKIAYHFLENEQDAEDAVNDVFFNIISQKCTIPTDDEEKCKAYLFICIRNRALRLKEMQRKNKAIDIQEFFSLSTHQSLEKEALDKELYDELLSFIKEMSPIYRDVMLLHIVFGKPLKEIAWDLSIPYKTAETRFIRGKAIIKERFGNIEI